MRSVMLVLLCVACSETGLRGIEDDPPTPPYADDPAPEPGDVEPPAATDFPAWSGNPLEFDPPQPPENPCDGDRTWVTHTVVFEATEGCAFGTGDNLTELDGRVRAQKVQTFDIPLDDDEVVCAVDFEFSADNGGMAFTDYQYDDHVVFTANDYIVFSSDWQLVNAMPSVSGYPVYDWLSIRDATMNFETRPWGLGDAGDIVFPPHDIEGDVFISVDSLAIDDLSSVVLGDGEMAFALYSYGDDNTIDCRQSGMTFEAYVQTARLP